MKPKPGLPQNVRLSEWLGRTSPDASYGIREYITVILGLIVGARARDDMAFDVRSWLKSGAKFALIGALIPCFAYLLSTVLPIFSTWLLTGVIFVCPSYIMFLATSACDAWDMCSMKALLLVAVVNASLYWFVGFVYGAVREGKRSLK